VTAHSWEWWLGFILFVLLMLALDLGVFQRRAHEIHMREALFWSAFWVLLALLFNLGLWLGWFGSYPPERRGQVALEYLTGYLIEKSLSLDNIFVFAVAFRYFAVPARYQHRALFYGILGALVFRAIFIFGGLWLIAKFAWMIYVFGGFLIITGVKLGLSGDRPVEPQKNPLLRLLRRFLPVSPTYDAGWFFTRVGSRRYATPLLLVVAFIEMSDVMFALDSIPAIIAITRDPFIVFTSNIFAILGLRALYFALAAFMRMFRYLSAGLSVLLVYIGGKMIVQAAFDWHVPVAISLGAVCLILGTAVVTSLLSQRANSGERAAVRSADSAD